MSSVISVLRPSETGYLARVTRTRTQKIAVVTGSRVGVGPDRGPGDRLASRILRVEHTATGLTGSVRIGPDATSRTVTVPLMIRAGVNPSRCGYLNKTVDRALRLPQQALS